MEISVNYTYDPPVSSAFLSAIRNSKFSPGILIKQENNISLYKSKELIASCSVDSYFQNNFIDSSKGKVYLDVDLREKL